MNREIKYRAWFQTGEDEGQKYSGMYQVERIAFDANIVEVKRDSAFAQAVFQLDKIILLQYVGLKDKNGKEIYEGDILDFGEWSDHSGRCLHTVIWNEEDACFSTYEPRETMTYNLDPFSEVIGNIMENPDLVEK